VVGVIEVTRRQLTLRDELINTDTIISFSARQSGRRTFAKLSFLPKAERWVFDFEVVDIWNFKKSGVIPKERRDPARATACLAGVRGEKRLLQLITNSRQKHTTLVWASISHNNCFNSH